MKLWKRIRQLSHPRGGARPFYVFGEQRSGTSMVLRTLDRHPGTECYYENDAEAYDRFMLREDDHIRRLVRRSRAATVVFKPLCDMHRASALLDTFGGKAIWIYRRFEDVVNSALREFTEHRKYLYYMLHEPEIARWRIAGVTPEQMSLVRDAYDRGLEDPSCRGLIWYIRNCLYFQQSLPEHPRATLLRYEALVDRESGEMRRMFDFAGLEWDEAYARNVHSSSVRRRSAPEIDASVRALCERIWERLERERRRIRGRGRLAAQ